MKFFNFRMLAVLFAAMIVAGTNAEAQGFGFSVTNSANSIQVSNSLTYTINVTNQLGFLADAVVSNTCYELFWHRKNCRTGIARFLDV